jgi:oligoendopeptidase F
LLLTRKFEIENNIARARGFANSSESFFSLGSGFPPDQTRLMLETGRASKPTIGRYAAILARVHRIRDVRYQDLLVAAPLFSHAVRMDEAKRSALEAFTPLGKEYQRMLAERFNKPWFDIEDHANKDPGAIGVYWQVGDGGHPYGILNYLDDFASARTLSAIGALTMFYSDIPNDKLPTAREDDFPVYGNAVWNLAPLLYADYLLAHTENRADRVAILMADLRRLYVRFVRNLIVTDFVSRVEAAVAGGHPPAGSQISELYRAALQDYNDESAAPSSPEDGEEWMSIGQLFYRGHVLDEFAFSIAASVGMHERVSARDPGVIKAIVHPLYRTNSYSDYDLMLDAGADPSKKSTYEAVFHRMNSDMDQLERALPRR